MKTMITLMVLAALVQGLDCALYMRLPYDFRLKFGWKRYIPLSGYIMWLIYKF